MSVSATTGLVLMTLLCRFQLLRAVEGVGEIFILYNYYTSGCETAVPVHWFGYICQSALDGVSRSSEYFS